MVRISDTKVDPVRPAPIKRTSFCVHADLLIPGAVRKAPHLKDPTPADVERTARSRSGQTDIGDEVAVALREAGGLEGVYWLAAKHLGATAEALKEKYKHLDNGRQRMVLGNRLRALVKTGKVKL